MGCIQSSDGKYKLHKSELLMDNQWHRDRVSSVQFCFQTNTNTSSLANQLTVTNDQEIDTSHFTRPREILGIGGFGLVRKVQKATGYDQNTIYAMKSISKGMVISRQSGLAAVMTELKTLILLNDCPLICHLQYAFQDDHQLYMIFDYASGGDLRYNLRKCPGYHFSERLSKIIILQTFLALEFCHSRNILHRGM